jgi:lambda repressor-like predicted transcriptional regulator
MFGFEYDSRFVHWAGARLCAGIESAEQLLRDSARKSGSSPAAYRKVLQKRYKQRLAAMHANGLRTEESSE